MTESSAFAQKSAFAEKYGPWAVVAGASEGVGRELARRVAANGVNSILIARREKPLAELWAELRPFGVDVLSLVLVMTDTPALRRLLAEKGQPVPSRIASAAQVAEVGLARLPLGPVYSWGPLAGLRAGWFRTRVRVFAALSKKVFGSENGRTTS